MKMHFSTHALKRMFERKITTSEVRSVIEAGEVIARYPNDRPVPSALWLGFPNGRALHVVAAHTDEGDTVVITVYEPDPVIWDSKFRSKLP
jgi:hypothetical protein